MLKSDDKPCIWWLHFLFKGTWTFKEFVSASNAHLSFSISCRLYSCVIRQKYQLVDIQFGKSHPIMVVIKLNFYSSPKNNTNRILLNNWRDPFWYFEKCTAMQSHSSTFEWENHVRKFTFQLNFILSLKLFQNNS